MSDEKLNIICPGQGAQHIGMGKAWAQNSPAAQDIFQQANDILNIDLQKICFDGPEHQLNKTDIAQAALYTASVASFRGLLEKQVIAENMLASVSGLSLGEFTALHIAGAYDFKTGLKLVRLRGQAMQNAADNSQGSMVALIGAEKEQAIDLCDKARGQGVLVPANFNCPGQIVISGDIHACNRALEVAKEIGLRATALKVAGAFHSPLMQPAADRLEAALDDATWKKPQITVISNVTAEPHPHDIPSIKSKLVQQLTSPVRWGQSMDYTRNNIPGQFIELAPNKVLSGLMRRIDRKTKVINYATPPA